MSVLDLARSAPGRAIAALCGLAAVAFILHRLGLSTVGHAIASCAAYFPLVLVFELGILTCSTFSLRALYGDAAYAVPPSQFIRAALIGYAVQGLVPAGRAAAEAARASLLARFVGVGRAGAAAARMQAVLLVANGLIAVICTFATLYVMGATWLPLAVAFNAVLTLGLGSALFLIARHARIGGWLGRRFKRARAFGEEVDAVLERDTTIPVRAIAWEFTGRTIQVVQHGILIYCVAGVFGLLPSLTAEGIHLVGAMVGDLIPAQLGAIEGNFTLASQSLGLSAAGAVSIALIVHLAQLAWVVVGSLVPLVWTAASRKAST